jgi:hypothetical protein
VRTAFTADAELGAGLALDTVPHESVLTVDEHGIEGAAAVVHEETGVPYFLARIADPVTS